MFEGSCSDDELLYRLFPELERCGGKFSGFLENEICLRIGYLMLDPRNLLMVFILKVWDGWIDLMMFDVMVVVDVILMM